MKRFKIKLIAGLLIVGLAAVPLYSIPTEDTFDFVDDDDSSSGSGNSDSSSSSGSESSSSGNDSAGDEDSSGNSGAAGNDAEDSGEGESGDSGTSSESPYIPNPGSGNSNNDTDEDDGDVGDDVPTEEEIIAEMQRENYEEYEEELETISEELNEEILRMMYEAEAQAENVNPALEEFYEKHPDLESLATCGDPVLVATGQYSSEEVDLSFSWGASDFDILRIYLSGENSGSALGKEWKSTFDTRIIRGSSKAEERLYKNMQEYLRNSYPSYDDYGFWYTFAKMSYEKLNATVSSMSNAYSFSKVAEEYNKYSMTEDMLFMNDTTGDFLCFVDLRGNKIIMKYDSSKKVFCPLMQGIGNRLTVTVNGNAACNGFKVKYYDGLEMNYSPYGLITSMKDRTGAELFFTYSEEMKITNISDKSGVILSLFWNDGHLISVKSNSTGKEVLYSYDENKLVAVSKSDGRFTKYSYNESGLMSFINKNDMETVRINYGESSEGEKVSSVGNESAGYERFNYENGNRKTIYTTLDRNPITYTVDNNGSITEVVNADGSWQKRIYDNVGRVAKMQDPYGIVTYEYNSFGLLSRRTLDTGAWESWTYTSDFNQVASHRNMDGIVTEYKYDSCGNCIAAYRVGKKVYEAAYDKSGNLISEKGIGINHKYEYNAKNQLVKQDGITILYDAYNNIESIVDVEGNRINYYRSSNGCEIKTVKNNRFEENKKYDAFGNLLVLSQRDLNTGRTFVTKYEYGYRGKVLRKFQGEGNSLNEAEGNLFLVESFDYTKDGLLKRSIRFNNGVAVENDGFAVMVEYSYLNGMLFNVKTGYINKKHEFVGTVFETNLKYKYEKGLYCIASIDENGNAFEKWFDREGRLCRTVNEEKFSLQYEYTAAGSIKSIPNVYGGKYIYRIDPVSLNVSSIENSENVLQRFEYDFYGNIQTLNDVDGFVKEYSYTNDENGFTVTTRTGLGSETVQYDTNGNVIRKILLTKNGINKSINYSATVKGFQIANSKMNNEIKTDAWGNILYDSTSGFNYEYDMNGNLIKAELKEKKISVRYSYNLFNKVSRVVSETGLVTDYSYDSNGNLISIREDGNLLWKGNYDSKNNLLREESLDYGTKVYTYDKSGLLVQVKHNGVVIQTITRSSDLRTWIYSDSMQNKWKEEYDLYGRIVSSTDKSGNKMTFSYNDKYGSVMLMDFQGKKSEIYKNKNSGENKIIYEGGLVEKINFDFEGNITSLKSNYNGLESFINYNYDSLSQLVSSVNNSSVATNKYDEKGQRVSCSVDGNSITYTRDQLGNISSILAKGQFTSAATNYAYDDFGREVRRVDSDGTTTVTEYDKKSNVVYKSTVAANCKNENYYFYNDANQKICEVTSTGFIIYEYDSFGRVVKYIRPATDFFLKEKEMDFTNLGISFTYTPCYESIREISSGNIYSSLQKKGFLYSSLLNQRSWVEEYEYDSNGNRVSCITSAGAVHYTFDKENRLVRISGDNNTQFIYDKNGRLVCEKSKLYCKEYSYFPNGRLKRIVSMNMDTGITMSHSYTYDSLGRTETVTDTDGSIVKYIYDGVSKNKLASIVERKQEINKTSGSASNNNYRYINSETFGTYMQDISLGSTGEEEKNQPSGIDDTLCLKERLFVEKNGILQFQLAETNAVFYETDMLGNTILIRNSAMPEPLTVSYDPYGNAYFLSNSAGSTSSKNNLTLYQNSQTVYETAMEKASTDILYKGMNYDQVSQTYDNFQRNFMPRSGCFTTPDPIKEGINWYAYCDGDGVNYTDSLGTSITNPVIMKYMQAYVESKDKGILLGNSDKATIGNSGCFLNLCCGIVNGFYGSNVEPDSVNKIKELFGTNKGEEDELKTLDVMDMFALKQETYARKDKKTENFNKEVKEKIEECRASETEYILGLRVEVEGFLSSGEYYKGSHFIGTDGTVIEMNGKEYCKVIQTSMFDNTSSGIRKNWKEKNSIENGKSTTNYYVPLDEVLELRAYSKLECD